MTSNSTRAESRLICSWMWEVSETAACLACVWVAGMVEEEKAPVGHSWCAAVQTLYLQLSYLTAGWNSLWLKTRQNPRRTYFILAAFCSCPFGSNMSVCFSCCVAHPSSYLFDCSLLPLLLSATSMHAREHFPLFGLLVHVFSSLCALWNQQIMFTRPGLPAPGEQAASSSPITLHPGWQSVIHARRMSCVCDWMLTAMHTKLFVPSFSS